MSETLNYNVHHLRPLGGGKGGGNTNQKEPEAVKRWVEKHQPEDRKDGGNTNKIEPDLEKKREPEKTAQNNTRGAEAETSKIPEQETINKTNHQTREKGIKVADKIKAYTQLDLGGFLYNKPEKHPNNLVQKPGPVTTEPETRPPKPMVRPETAQGNQQKNQARTPKINQPTPQDQT